MIAVAFVLFVGSLGAFMVGVSEGNVRGALLGLGFAAVTGTWVIWEVSKPHDDGIR